MSAVVSSARPTPRNPILALSRLFNPLVLRFAGTRVMPLYGVLEHRGRRSGNVFHTPVVARPSGDGFVVPMPWGTGTDWYRNVAAAGGCALRWKGRTFALTSPEVVDVAQASFGGLQRAAMGRFGIKQALLLKHV